MQTVTLFFNNSQFFNVGYIGKPWLCCLIIHCFLMLDNLAIYANRDFVANCDFVV